MSRALIPTLLCASMLLACGESIDRAAAHEHELIDHEYDRKDQLAKRIFDDVHEVIDHQHDANLDLLGMVLDTQVGLFTAVLEAGPPPGFGPSTCSFTSSPSGAEVFQRNVFDEWEFVGRTPLVVERPFAHARPIEVRASGHVTAKGYMVSDAVHGACEDHFELTPST